mmetsp:Transcript_1636/g.2208  ORF Transcript_1636/g.2208 Transcript_1636/m.2208 type:complete len:217 (-) Transcript_1636:170-820(-)
MPGRTPSQAAAVHSANVLAVFSGVYPPPPSTINFLLRSEVSLHVLVLIPVSIPTPIFGLRPPQMPATRLTHSANASGDKFHPSFVSCTKASPRNPSAPTHSTTISGSYSIRTLSITKSVFTMTKNSASCNPLGSGIFKLDYTPHLACHAFPFLGSIQFWRGRIQKRTYGRKPSSLDPCHRMLFGLHRHDECRHPSTRHDFVEVSVPALLLDLLPWP